MDGATVEEHSSQVTAQLISLSGNGSTNFKHLPPLPAAPSIATFTCCTSSVFRFCLLLYCLLPPVPCGPSSAAAKLQFTFRLRPFKMGERQVGAREALQGVLGVCGGSKLAGSIPHSPESTRVSAILSRTLLHPLNPGRAGDLTQETFSSELPTARVCLFLFIRLECRTERTWEPL